MIVRHYKGGLYVVLAEGIHTETEEELVFYTDYTGKKFYARPKAMFYSKAPDGYGQEYRFQELKIE